MVPAALLLSAGLFSLGLLGVLLRRNVITVFLCIELMLNAVNLAFIAFSRHWGTTTLAPSGVRGGGLDAQVLVFFVLTVAAAEAAVGLAIVIALHRHRDTLDVDAFDLLKR
jgi:NADH-quinone oxidoreductase subunit K